MNINLLHKLPRSFRPAARDFLEKKTFRGPVNPIAENDSDRVLLESEQRIIKTIQQDNTKMDRNLSKGSVETDEVKVTYAENDEGTEFYSESVGSGPLKIVSLSRTSPEGLDTILAVIDERGEVAHSGAIHLNRLYAEESFVAGDLRELPS